MSLTSSTPEESLQGTFFYFGGGGVDWMLKFRIDQHMPDINYAQSDTIEEENKIGKHLAET